MILDLEKQNQINQIYYYLSNGLVKLVENITPAKEEGVFNISVQLHKPLEYIYIELGSV